MESNTLQDRASGSIGIDEVGTAPTSSTPQAPSRQAEVPLHVLMSPEQNVQRIMHTGSLWFMAAPVLTRSLRNTVKAGLMAPAFLVA